MITIKEPLKYSFGVVKYDPKLDKAIKNWHKTCMVKQFNGWVYINKIAIGYFCELLRKDNVDYELLTEVGSNVVLRCCYRENVIERSHKYSL